MQSRGIWNALATVALLIAAGCAAKVDPAPTTSAPAPAAEPKGVEPATAADPTATKPTVAEPVPEPAGEPSPVAPVAPVAEAAPEPPSKLTPSEETSKVLRLEIPKLVQGRYDVAVTLYHRQGRFHMGYAEVPERDKEPLDNNRSTQPL